MIVNLALLSKKEESLDKLKKIVEKEGFEVLEMNTAFKVIQKSE
jgi:acetolactate synthase regulatory subunit